MGVSNSNYNKEKGIANSPEPIYETTMKIILRQMEECICKIRHNDEINGTGSFFVLFHFQIKLSNCLF